MALGRLDTLSRRRRKIIKKNYLSPGLDCRWFSFSDQDNLRKNDNDVVMLESLWSYSGFEFISVVIIHVVERP